VRLPDGPYDAAGAPGPSQARAALIGAFESAYREKFGRTPPDVPVELVNLRVTANAPPRRAFEAASAAQSGGASVKARRPVYFKETGAYTDTPIYERSHLPAGFRAAGPMVIEDPSSSLVVGPKGHVEHLASGNLVITIQD
jgi:N-methylhydantoinase A